MYDLTTVSEQRAPVAPVPHPASLGTIITRIEEAIEAETAGIRTDIGYDITASNARKSRYLYELNRAMKGVSPENLPAEHQAALTRLREKLADNQRAIMAHLNAVSEIAQLLQDAIRRSEADGTYCEQQFGRAG